MADGNSNDSGKCVVVPLSRLPQNLGDMLNRFLSGDIVSLHIIGATQDGKVISASTTGIPDEIKQYDCV